MELFQIKDRWNGGVKFEGRFLSFKLCVEAAFSAKVNLRGADLRNADLSCADLSGADLSGADLRYANLSGADLNGVKIIALTRRATRADGYEFILWETESGWRVTAGCRFFTLDEAWSHWEQTRGGSPLGDESLDILTMFELHIQRVTEG